MLKFWPATEELLAATQAEYQGSSRPEVFCKEGDLRNFTKFTGKHLWQKLFIKKETLAQVFSCEFCEISKEQLFLYNKSGGYFRISRKVKQLNKYLVIRQAHHEQHIGKNKRSSTKYHLYLHFLTSPETWWLVPDFYLFVLYSPFETTSSDDNDTGFNSPWNISKFEWRNISLVEISF